MFATRTTKTVETKGGPVRVRKLSWSEQQEARVARSAAQVSALRALGPELLKAVQDAGAVDKAERSRAERDDAARRKARYDEYDRAVTLRYGVIGWDDVAVGRKFTREALNDLEDDVAQQLHEAVVDLTAPPIEEQREETAKD